MSYVTMIGAPPMRRRRRGRIRTAAAWLVKLSVTAALGVAGYFFVWDVAAPYLVSSLVGR